VYGLSQADHAKCTAMNSCKGSSTRLHWSIYFWMIKIMHQYCGNQNKIVYKVKINDI